MKLLLHIKNKEFEVQNIQKLKEHIEYLNNLIDTYEETEEQVVFNIPSDILK